MHRTAQRRLGYAPAQTFPFYPEMTLFFFLLAVFQDQLDSHFFFSCFYGRAGGEDGFVYKALLFLLSTLDYMQVPYKYEDMLTTLYLQAS